MQKVVVILSCLAYSTYGRSIHLKPEHHAARQVQSHGDAAAHHPSTALASLLLAISPSSGWQTAGSIAVNNQQGGRSHSAVQMRQARDFDGLTSQPTSRRAAVTTALLASFGAGFFAPKPAAAIPKPGCSLTRLQSYITKLDEVKEKIQFKTFSELNEIVATSMFVPNELAITMTSCGISGDPDIEKACQNIRSLRSITAQMSMMGSASNAECKEAIAYVTDTRTAIASFMKKTGFPQDEIDAR
mmetsp:Transcript_53560/g.93112  ORF Transcript_53560/g.93112 Transcript_53560/m.93112 type:complete len:244 (-) Transcript_53560:32-763(-)